MKRTGDQYFDSADFRDMLHSYEQALDEGQPVLQDADELADIADYYQMVERPDDAERAITLALSLSPGAAAPLTYRIHEALWQGDTQLARHYLSQIIERSEPDYVYCQGEILLAEGDVDGADRYFADEMKQVPMDEMQDYVFDVANIFQDYEQSEKAMQWMARAKREETDDFKELMGRMLFGVGKYKEAESLFAELIDRDPFSAYYWTAQSSAQFMNEDYAESLQSSEYALAINPDEVDALMAKANALYHLGNYEEALKFYRRYADHEPDDEFALLHEGTCLINMGQTDEAIELLERALTITPADSPYLPDLLQELAFAYSDQDNIDRAIELLDRTDSLDCDHPQLEVIKGHVLLAAGRIDDAQEHYRQAIELSDDPNQMLLRVIVSVYDNHYLEAAYRLFNHYFSIVGDDTNEGYAYRALCCRDLKRYDEFMRYLRIACERNPQECRLVLAHIFPDEIEPKDYYTYLTGQMRRKD